MRIRRLEMLALNVPFYCERVRRHMHRALTHGERVYVYRVELSNGIIGYGESLGNESGRIDPLIDQDSFALIYDDSVGAGIQMSLLDAVGKSLEVPIYQLLGKRLRDRCPISWWDIDMPPEDWVEEVQESIRRGYTSAKLKARPWRDIFAQVEAVTKAIPEGYHLDIDFNGFLHTADEALPVLQILDRSPNVAYYESPFFLGTDMEGAKRLQAKVEKRIVEHFNEACLHAGAGDGFVVGGGATGVRHINSLCASFGKPFWLQMVGTGITAAFSLHLGAVLSQAQLPAITCHELWEHDLLTERLAVKEGMIAIPERPGLGVEIDESALERYRVDVNSPTPQQRSRQASHLYRVHIPDAEHGETIHEFTGEDVYYPAFFEGKYPGFVPGVWLENAK